MKKYILFILLFVSINIFAETNYVIETNYINKNSLYNESIKYIPNETNTSNYIETNYREMFDNYLFKVIYDEKNIPSYTFFSNTNKKWELTNTDRNEYMYEGSNSMAGGFPLTSVKYYVYRSKNPMFSIESEYQRFMKNFYFYRYTAKGGGVVNIESFPIAVDVNTKYIFQYTKPKEFKKVFGNNVPVKFESIEESFCTNKISTNETNICNTVECENKVYMFYEYDPIGFVNDDGNVTLYDFYIENEANKIYEPRYTGASPYAQKQD